MTTRTTRSSRRCWPAEPTAIPLEARIIAAVDAWSAMTTDRPYPKAMSEAVALAELERVAGAQLDPDVVVALRSVLARPRELDR